MNKVPGLIVGSREDVHVQRVLELAETDLVVIDAQSLSSSSVTIDLDSIEIQTAVGAWRIGRGDSVGRGWVRRLAPEHWQHGVVAGSLASAEQSGWLSLLGAVGRSPLLNWLTTIDNGLIGENKHYQLVKARSVGIPVPDTLVTNRADLVAGRLPGARVVKALGRAHFTEGKDARVVFTQPIDDDSLASLGRDIPMIYQAQLVPIAHLRVVVVRDQVWTCSLDAEDLPLDWRSEPSAHDAFKVVETPPRLGVWARAATAALGLGYASQDWIVTAEGPLLVDVNPGGQWLFLPEPVATEVAMAIVTWLEG